MEVKPGYKQTELVIIPNDWEIKNLGSIANVTKLAGFEYSNYFNSYRDGGEIIVIRGTNITNNRLDLTDVKTISHTISKKLLRSKLFFNDLVFAYVGTIGPVYLIKENNKFHLGPNTSKITVSNSILANYLFIYFTSWLIKNEITEKTSIGAQPSLSMTKIRLFKIVFPNSIQEQTAIAQALSDTDELISLLDKLITKKRNIKQGAMQQLLSCKKRLPGFSGEWVIKKLGAIADIRTGKKNNEDKVENGTFPFFVRSQKVERINSYSFDGEAILVPGEGGIGTIIHYINGKFDYHQRVYKISDFKSGIMGKYIFFYMMENFDKQATRNSVKATVDSLRLPTFKEFEIQSPSFEEQTAIAQILSDMDSEIETLEKKRDKYKSIKQGMMQELLTGKTRLI